MPDKITSASAEQWEAVERCRQRWMTTEQTAQYSVAEIRDTARLFCDRLGVRPAAIWVVDSPFVASVLEYALGTNLDDNLSDNLGVNLNANLRANLVDNLRANLSSNLSYNLSDNLGDNLNDNLYDNLGANLNANLGDNLGVNLNANLRANLVDNLGDNLNDNLYDNLGANLRANLRANLGNLSYYCGVWWNSWAGWFEGADILGVPRIEEYDLFQRWNRHCPVWMWSESSVYILRRPKTISWHESGIGLHCDDGPAVYWSPFFAMWMIEGVRVDEQIVMRPDTQTIEQIDQEENEEVRRVRIERFGWERYLRESGAEEVDSRHNDRDAQEERLMRTHDGMQRFMCVDPSTGRRYSLGVPRDITTCEQAQSWMSHGLDRFAIHRS